MITTLRNCILTASCALALSALGQSPTPTLAPPASATPVAAAVSASPAASPDSEDDLESRIDRKVKKGLHISIGSDHRERERERERARERDHDSDNDDIGGLMAIPIVGIIFTTLFGAPVLVVAAIMFFSYLKSRSLHRTVRTMVERGEPVPPALFAPPTIIRARSDMRRGVVLVMVGIGLMIFFGACSEWDGGAWAIGIIPFLIGAGYLLVWKLEGHKPNGINTSTDNTPRVP